MEPYVWKSDKGIRVWKGFLKRPKRIGQPGDSCSRDNYWFYHGSFRILKPTTLLILGIGLLAFVFDTAGGVLFAKLVNIFLKRKVNPMIGAAGISAFPMSARVVQKIAQEEDPTNFILMQAIGANVAGQIGSVIAGGVLLSLLG